MNADNIPSVGTSASAQNGWTACLEVENLGTQRKSNYKRFCRSFKVQLSTDITFAWESNS